MKISLNQIKFLNQHYGCARNPYEYGIDEILHKIGVQLGAVEDVELGVSLIGKKRLRSGIKPGFCYVFTHNEDHVPTRWLI